MPPSVSGMEPPFGDAFQNYSFADQALTSTELLATSSDPDFMYELDTDMSHQQSPCGDSIVGVGDGGKEVEGGVDQLMGLGECETVHSSSAFEQWDSYWEDLTRYTRLASCDIWGTKEVDFLGLDDFSSPYQDEEVISRTPTLAQLNSEDSLPVCEALYPPVDLTLPCSQPPSQPLPSQNKRLQGLGVSSVRPSPCSASSSQSRPSRSLFADFPESSQKATRPVASSTETMAKTQKHADFVRKAKVRVSSGPRPQGEAMPQTDFERSDPPLPLSQPQDEKPSTSASAISVDPEQSKEEEHNYSLFLTRSRALTQLEEDEEEEDDEEPEEDEGDGLDLDDEDHDEGFGSEHELSENEEEEEEEEDEDYEADKDDDMSDAFSEPGCDMELMDDIKGLTAGVSSRKRGKRRYFWEYSEQLTPSKQERMLKPSEWDRHTLPSNMYQKNGPLHGKYMLKKSRRTDVEDLTPNPRKLLQIGTELRKLNKVISDLTPVSELPLTARPRSRKEKNKLASRACRLKKKAQYEANKVKLWGLSTEYDRLLFVINAIKEEIMVRVEDSSPRPTNMTETLERLIEETLVPSPVAGQTSDFVNKILENTGRGDPTGGLVGLRVPTSKM
uniref:BZIP domain-containing protein n=1 Tax=Poecilia mexicana TaxID=48701 RepID=A0A3B3WC83_9TELE